MLMTAKQAREVALDNLNYPTELDVYIEKQIAEAAYNGKTKYFYNDILPLYLKDILEMNGYTVTENWWDEEGWRTYIMW